MESSQFLSLLTVRVIITHHYVWKRRKCWYFLGKVPKVNRSNPGTCIHCPTQVWQLCIFPLVMQMETLVLMIVFLGGGDKKSVKCLRAECDEKRYWGVFIRTNLVTSLTHFYENTSVSHPPHTVLWDYFCVWPSNQNQKISRRKK